MYRINVQNLSFTSAKQHQVRSFYSIRDPSYYWYEVMENSKQQARGLKRKVSDLLNVVKSEISPKEPPSPITECESCVSLCARTIASPEIPSKYRKSLQPYVAESNFIKESRLMTIPARSIDYDRLTASKELDEVNQTKQNFARSLHSKNVTGMMLKDDGISYYMTTPVFYSSSDPYEIPGLKTELLTIKLPHKAVSNISHHFSDSDTHYPKKTNREIYFTPKRLRKYPD